jgi:hypothetical protein
MEGQQVKITLGNYNTIFQRSVSPGYLKAVQDVSLMVDARFGRIVIFWLSSSDHSSPEPDHPLMKIEDREDDPPPEGVIPSFLFLGKDQTQFPCELQRDLFFPKVLYQTIPAVQGVTQSIFFDDFLLYFSLGEIPPRLSTLPPHGKEIVEIFRSDLIDLEEDLPLHHFLLLGWGKFLGRKLNSVTLRQFLYGLRKGKVSHLHQKGKDISSFPTAEAVKDLFFFVDHEGRGFFGMEGTEPFMVLSSLF